MERNSQGPSNGVKRTRIRMRQFLDAMEPVVPWVQAQ